MTGKRAENSMEIRAYITVRSLLGLKPVDIHREVCDIFGDGQMSHRSVCRWVPKFKADQHNLKDVARSVRPPTTATKSYIKKITDSLNKDARYTLRDLARFANFSLAQVHGILRKHLCYWRPLLQAWLLSDLNKIPNNCVRENSL